MESHKLVKQFGVQPIEPSLIERIEKLTNRPAHHFLKRGIFCGHRDLDKILDDYQAGKPFYLYTGRGPSSSSLHLGHLIPLEFTRYLQEVFQAPLIIQMTDDEKYLRNSDKNLDQIREYTEGNLKDLIAIGFDPKLTFIFSDIEQIHRMYPNILKMQRKINLNQIQNIFGLRDSQNIGEFAFPVNQAVPALSSTFPELFAGSPRCLIPCAVDQDVYFRMTRDLCQRLKKSKPSVIHSVFLPDIRARDGKMSSTSSHSNPAVIFLNYTPKRVAKIINKHAFSGGQVFKEDQAKLGADLAVDMSFRYLEFFMEDDQRLQEIADQYSSGKMMTGEIKKILIDCLNTKIVEFQRRREGVTSEMIAQFKEYRQLKY